MRPLILGLLVVATTTACGEIVDPRPRPGLTDELVLYARLMSDSARQAVAVGSADDADPTLSNVTVRLLRQAPGQKTARWNLVASARTSTVDSLPGSPCSYGLDYCLTLPVTVEPGATYKVEAFADGRPTATGTTRVVGRFDIERAALSENNVLAATWTDSQAAHRYMMGVMRYETTCTGCSRAWHTEINGTSFEGTIPQEAVDSAGPVPTLVVSAVDRHFHAFLTTGHGGQLFKVPPVQNVEGGFGVVGSIQHASRPIAMNR